MWYTKMMMELSYWAIRLKRKIHFMKWLLRISANCSENMRKIESQK